VLGGFNFGGALRSVKISSPTWKSCIRTYQAG